MNRMDLVEKIAEKNAISKAEANRILGTVIEEVMAGESLTLVGFGTFKLQDRPERTGRNPATGDAITIPAAKVPKFVPSSAFKAAVNCCCKK